MSDQLLLQNSQLLFIRTLELQLAEMNKVLDFHSLSLVF